MTQPVVITHEMWLTVAITVLTNLCALPCMVIAWRNRRMHECVVAAALTLVSILYHSSEALHMRIWGMNPGQWHRLDNIFIITVLTSLALCMATADPDAFGEATPYELEYLSAGRGVGINSSGGGGAVRDVKKRRRRDQFLREQRSAVEMWRWVFLVITVICQEAAPWVEFFTFLPIGIGWFVAMARLLWFTPKEFRPMYSGKTLSAGIVCLLLGLYCFIRGLDDENDYLRMWHGMWHLFAALGIYCMFRSKKQLSQFLQYY